MKQVGQGREPASVEFSIDDHDVAYIRLSRPDARNALDQRMGDALYDVAQQCAVRDGLRAVLIMGNGPAFTVGGDITVLADVDPRQLPAVIRRMATLYHEALRIFSELPAPVITAVHGSVAGGGLGLLYCADVVLAAEGTRFVTGFTSVGIPGDGASTWFLPRLVGLRRAQELYFRQRVFDAEDAARWGLVSEVVPAAELAEVATGVARELATGPTKAFGEIRRLLRNSWSASLADQLTAEIDAQSRVAGTLDASRALQSFVHRTKPIFVGQ